jgi:hypothetical protein
VVNFVTATGFQSYWRNADKKIQASESGCHFGHSKAASHDKYLTALHCAKLTLAATTGIPPARWGQGLTVLLERIFENMYVGTKMHKFPLLVMDMPVCILGSVHVLAHALTSTGICI